MPVREACDGAGWRGCKRRGRGGVKEEREGGKGWEVGNRAGRDGWWVWGGRGTPMPT
jgi:hypothetical protein